MNHRIRQRALPAGCLVAALLSGCATTRGILDVPLQEVANPATGVAVKIGSVTDSRRFQVDPPQPSIPSLKDGQIENQALTSRAIARKRNGYGKALGDILLPEGQTVAGLAAATVTRGLRAGGFRVLTEGQPGFEDALPIDVDIEQFWAWFTPGFFAAHLEFEARITLTGPVPPFRQGEPVRGYVRLSTQAATTRAWRNTVEKGLTELENEIGARIRAAPPAQLEGRLPRLGVRSDLRVVSPTGVEPASETPAAKPLASLEAGASDARIGVELTPRGGTR